MKTRIHRYSMASLAALVLLFSGVVAAQDRSESEDSIEVATIDVITVTAQKREQNLQEVPVSIQVMDGQAVEDNVILNTFDLAAYIPGVSIDDSIEIRTTTLKTRGIGTFTNSIGLQSSNLIAVDGEVLPRQSMANLGVYDLERVEVLRGPQGTLFGQNTSTGLIHYVTKRPDLYGPGGYLRLQASEYSGFDTRASINLPLNDSWAIRLNGQWATIDGYIKNTFPGADDIGDEERSGYRAQVLYDNQSDFNFLLRADYSEFDTNCCANTAVGEVNLDGNTALIFEDGVPRIGGSNALNPPPSFETFNAPAVAIGGSQFGSTENTGFSAELNYDIRGNLTLTYIGSYRDFELLNNTDGFNSNFPISRRQFGGNETVEVLQQEVRLSSYDNERVNWTAGLFYHKTEGQRSEVNDRCTGGAQAAGRVLIEDGELTGCVSRASAQALVDEYNSSGVVDRTLLVPDRRLDQGNFTTDFENTAVFGQLEFRLTDRLDFLLGARALREESSATFQSIRVALPAGATGLETFEEGLAFAQADPTLFRRFNDPESFSNSENDVIYKAVLGFNASDSTRLYFNYSTGYKGPSYFITSNTDPADADQFPTRPEESENLELGLRSVLFDGRLQVNATLFDMTINDYQVRATRVIDELTGEVFAGYVNAEEANSRGVEIDATYRPTDQLSLYASLAKFDADFEDFSNVPINCPGGTLESRCETIAGANRFDMSGLPFPNNSETQFYISTRYEWPIGAGDSVVFVRGDYRYEGDRTRSVNQIAQEAPESPAYGIADLYVGVSGERVSAQVFAKNVFDDVYSSRFAINTLGFGRAFYPRDYRRFVGASVRFDF